MNSKFPHLVRPPASDAPSPFESMLRRPLESHASAPALFPKLEAAVRRHLVRLRLPSKRETANVFLVIQGPAGSGKSANACLAAERLGYGCALVEPGFLASEVEGGANSKLHDLMSELVRLSREERRPYVAIMDDMDTGICARGANEGVSSNYRLLNGGLQHLADHRPYRNFDGSPLGILVTGNSFDEMRAPLFRDMRANFFTHQPDTRAKRRFACAMLDAKTPWRRACVSLLCCFMPGEQIAFWAALRNDLDDLRLDHIIAQGLDDIDAADRTLSQPRFSAVSLFRLALARRAARAGSFL